MLWTKRRQVGVQRVTQKAKPVSYKQNLNNFEITVFHSMVVRTMKDYRLQERQHTQGGTRKRVTMQNQKILNSVFTSLQSREISKPA